MSPAPLRVLVLDDEFDGDANPGSADTARLGLLRTLDDSRFSIEFLSCFDPDRQAFDQDRALAHVREFGKTSDGLLLDVMFGRERHFGLELLPRLTNEFPALPVILVTAVPRRELLQQAMQLGAVDYIVKPVLREALIRSLDRFVGVKPKHWLIGQSGAFLQCVDLISRASEGGRSSIFISGESGTGKELLAEYVHRHGPRRSYEFARLHVANITPELFEARLFGHSANAFTGAKGESPGEFVKANKGVVFLDEVANISPDIQARLLRVTESGEVARAGDGKVTDVDVQIVSATNADISRHVKDGLFRADLWNRLSAMPVIVPTLRERREDILLLAQQLVRVEAIERGGLPVSRIPTSIAAALLSNKWSGNVRDLRNFVSRAFDLSEGKAPDETAFSLSLGMVGGPVGRERSSIPVSESNDTPDHLNQAAGTALDPIAELQRIRLQELNLLIHALELTRHPVSRIYNRSAAMQWLTGKVGQLTNPFNRRFAGVWEELNEESRRIARDRWPAAISQMAPSAAEQGKES